MSIADPPVKSMTAEELMALHDDGIHREIVNGVLIERPAERLFGLPGERPITLRNRVHCRIEARIATVLNTWLDNRPRPCGEIICGEVGFRLKRDPETLVGIDVAYASADLVAGTDPRSAFYDGPPPWPSRSSHRRIRTETSPPRF